MALKVSLAVVAVLASVLISVAAAMYFGALPVPGPLLAVLVGSREPEGTARYYPAGADLYVWATLAPGDRQLADLRDLWGRLETYPAFVKFLDDAKLWFADEAGVDFDVDVLPWAGPEISVVSYGMDGGREVGVGGSSSAFLVGVRDDDLASLFLSKWLEQAGGSGEGSFSRGSLGGFEVWSDGGGSEFYALVDDWLVYADDVSLMEDILARLDGSGGLSLFDDPGFMAARSVLPELRFASFYLDYRGGVGLLDSLAFGPPGLGSSALAGPAPDWVAGSVGLSGLDLVLEVVSPDVGGWEFEVPLLEEPATMLPADTLAFVAGAFDPDVDRWRAALAEYSVGDFLFGPGVVPDVALAPVGTGDGESSLGEDATLADVLDQALLSVRETVGVDLESEFLDHLSGRAVLAVRDFDLAAVSGDPLGNPVDALAMLSYREGGANALAGALERAGTLLRDSGIASDEADVGGERNAVLFDLDVLGLMSGRPVGYRPGYVLNRGYLTLGTTESSLGLTVDLQGGRGDSLSDVDGYRRAREYLPVDLRLVGYVDLDSAAWWGVMEEMDLSADQVRLLSDALGVALSGSASDGSHARTVLALTLFPG